VVLGVSPDSTERHCRFREKHGLAVTLLSDPEGETMRRYGAFGGLLALGLKALGVTRSTVLIDPQGKIAHVWPKVSARGHAAEVLEVLRELRDA
jgi:peroxiredoxin Q/BCP